MSDYRFGRRYVQDERDRRYLMPPRRLSEAPRARYWHADGVLDQGFTAECIGYAGHKYLTAGPTRNVSFPLTPTQLYKLSQQNDEWPGDDYEGTSVRGLFKTLNKLGFVSGYSWTWDVETMMAHVLTVGPVVVGTKWFDAMVYPSMQGVIHPVGRDLGGHAYLIIGGNRDKGLCRVLNSWGPGWGQNGRAWISFEDMQTLLLDSGECCTATEIRR